MKLKNEGKFTFVMLEKDIVEDLRTENPKKAHETS